MEYAEPYRILGLDAQADPEDIKSAFRYLAKKYHPDRSGKAATGVRFGQVVRAYKVLNSESPKARYLNGNLDLPGREEDLFALGTAALTAPEATERRRAVRRLGFSGKKSAYLFLRRALSDPDESVVGAAVRAIADLSACQASGEIAALWARASAAVRGTILDIAEDTGEPLFKNALDLASGEAGLLARRARRILQTEHTA